jgi:hypothetical protein
MAYASWSNQTINKFRHGDNSVVLMRYEPDNIPVRRVLTCKHFDFTCDAPVPGGCTSTSNGNNNKIRSYEKMMKRIVLAIGIPRVQEVIVRNISRPLLCFDSTESLKHEIQWTGLDQLTGNRFK